MVGDRVVDAAGLEPAVEFAMVQEQRVRALGVEDPRRGGDVADRKRAFERVGVRLDERHDPVAHYRLSRIARRRGAQFGDELRYHRGLVARRAEAPLA